MKQLLLWDDADIAPRRAAEPKPAKKVRLCGSCKKKMPRKPRSVMPIGHAFETVQGIFIERLDSMTDDIARIVGEEVGSRFEVDHRQLASCAGRIIDGINYLFFPEAYEDGPEYTPDPSGRMDIPPTTAGLIPRLPTVAILARHLLDKGRQSPVVRMTTVAKDRQGNEVSVPVFTDADLIRLGERIERREKATKSH